MTWQERRTAPAHDHLQDERRRVQAERLSALGEPTHPLMPALERIADALEVLAGQSLVRQRDRRDGSGSGRG